MFMDHLCSRKIMILTTEPEAMMDAIKMLNPPQFSDVTLTEKS